MRALAIAISLIVAGGVLPATAPALHAQDQQSEDTKRIDAAAAVVQSSLNAWRARNFEKWLSHFSPDVTVAMDAGTILGRDQLRTVYKAVFDMNLRDPEVLDSGWTGEMIWVRQREFGPDGSEVGVSYAEYEVRGGKITRVYGVQVS